MVDISKVSEKELNKLYYTSSKSYSSFRRSKTFHGLLSNGITMGVTLMDKELAQYINTLLAEKEREVKSRQIIYH